MSVTPEQLRTLEHCRANEIAAWKIVEHRFDNVHTVRTNGEIQQYTGEADAVHFIKNRGILALLKAYHQMHVGEP